MGLYEKFPKNGLAKLAIFEESALELILLFGRKTQTSMTISLNALGIVGTVLFWLGVIFCVISVYLFIAVSNGISDGTFPKRGSFDETTSILTFPHWDKIIIGWRERLVFLLPFVAGIALVITGTYVRGRIPKIKEAFSEINSNFQAEQDGTSNGG